MDAFFDLDFRKGELFLIFPLDVNKRVVNKSKLVGENKVQFYVTIFIVFAFALFLALNFIFTKMLGLSFIWVIVCELVICLFVFGFLIHYVIFDAPSKELAYEGFESDSFTRYLALRKDFNSQVTLGMNKAYFFEYMDGSNVCTIAFRFGDNDKYHSEQTRLFWESVIHEISNYSFESRVIVDSEDYEQTAEFKQHMRYLNGHDNNTLRKINILISKQLVEYAKSLSNVDIVYLTIRTKSAYQKDDFIALLKVIVQLYSRFNTAIRGMTFLDFDSLIDFYMNFYGMEAIDLSLMKAMDTINGVELPQLNLVETFGIQSGSKLFKAKGKRENIFKTDVKEVH